MVAPGAAAPAQLTADEAQTAYGKVGMSFEANQGQTSCDEAQHLQHSARLFHLPRWQ